VKVNTIRTLLRHKWVGVAWLFNACFSIGLVAASAHVVLRWAPAAAGSGVPEVMAQLNGCKLPRTFEWRTAGVKFLSAVLCVGSGLPVGPEGPMIFLGATLGGLISQGTGFLRRWPLLRRFWPFERFRNSKDKRDFMTAGCAAGVAAAFGAPIGGLLFVFEDVASSWTPSLGWQVFIACMVSVFSRSLADSLRHGDFFGLFRDGILFEVTRPVKTHAAASVVSVVVGVACGVAAAAFTAVTLAWDRRVRARFVAQYRWRRLAEPCVYMLLFLTLAIVLPFAFPCRESGCVAMPDGALVCKEDSAIARDLFYAGDGRLLERAVEVRARVLPIAACLRVLTQARYPFCNPPGEHGDVHVPAAAQRSCALRSAQPRRYGAACARRWQPHGRRAAAAALQRAGDADARDGRGCRAPPDEPRHTPGVRLRRDRRLLPHLRHLCCAVGWQLYRLGPAGADAAHGRVHWAPLRPRGRQDGHARRGPAGDGRVGVD
jgi:hypothetical protein